jgi:predicted transcriptional regulator of viral defense system
MKTLGTRASLLLSRLSEFGKDIFNLQEAQKILGTNSNSTRKLVFDLIQRNWLKRLSRGKYLLVPLSVANRSDYTVDELLIASHLISPYYISWWTALHYYGYTEQVSRKVYIGTLTQKTPVTIAGVTYQFSALTRTKFFGFADIWIQDKKVTIAKREKMIIDCLDRPDLCGGLVEATKGLWNSRKELDFSLLVRYALRMNSGAVCKRLGYLLEFFKLGTSATLIRLKKGLRTGYSLLDPSLPNTGPYLSQWNLRVNIQPEDLESWKGH